MCRALGADPWSTLAGRGQPVAVIGAAEPGRGVHDTADRPIPRREPDEVDRVLLSGAPTARG